MAIDSEKLVVAINQRIAELQARYNDARYFGDSHAILRFDSSLTMLKHILEEATV